MSNEAEAFCFRFACIRKRKDNEFMKSQPATPMRIAKWGYIAASVLFIFLGILFIVFPETSILVMVKLSAVIMMLFGLIKLVGYFSKDLYRLAFQFDLEFGILLFVLGLVVLIKSSSAVNFLCIALGIVVLTDGLFKMRISFNSKNIGISEWWLTFAVSILAILIGLVLVFKPSNSANVIMAVLGISLIVDGLLNLCVAFASVKIIKGQYPDVIESNDFEFKE